MADPDPGKPHGDQSLFDPLLSGQGGETDTPVPETVTPPPGSCVLPRMASRVPCPKFCAWLLHSTTWVWQTPESGNMVPFLPETTFPPALLGVLAPSLLTHTLSFFSAVFSSPGLL